MQKDSIIEALQLMWMHEKILLEGMEPFDVVVVLVLYGNSTKGGECDGLANTSSLLVLPRLRAVWSSVEAGARAEPLSKFHLNARQ